MRAFAALLALALSTMTPSHAVLPPAGWTPASQGLVPKAAGDSGYVWPYNFHVTRLRSDPSAPGRVFAGDLFHGLYVHTGSAWKSLTPGCLLDRANPLRSTVLASSGLTACGVLDIAIDPLDAKTIYVSTVDTQGLLRDPRFDPGGVFRSSDGGVHWTRISKAFRASGLAVAHTPGKPAVIVAGSFQRATHDVGTTTSVLVSPDDGRSWRGVTFKAPAGCPSNYVAVTPHLVANMAFHPTNPNIIYAGTNAGLYMSTTKGTSWSLALKACGKYPTGFAGGAWGIAFARQASKVTVYSGSFDGVIRRANPGSTAWTTVAKINAEKIQNIIVDVRNPSRLYVATWGQRGVQGVYRVVGSSVKLLSDNTLKDVAGRISALPKVYGYVKDATTLHLAQHPLLPDLIYASTVTNGIFVRSEAQ